MNKIAPFLFCSFFATVAWSETLTCPEVAEKIDQTKNACNGYKSKIDKLQNSPAGGLLGGLGGGAADKALNTAKQMLSKCEDALQKVKNVADKVCKVDQTVGTHLTVDVPAGVIQALNMFAGETSGGGSDGGGRGVAGDGSGGSSGTRVRTTNKSGFYGVNKTQSAQSLGHTRLQFTALTDVNMSNKVFPLGYGSGLVDVGGYDDDFGYAEVTNFMGMSLYTGFALGLGEHFDIGASLPVYYDQYAPPNGDMTKQMAAGNMDVNIKISIPGLDEFPIDLALFAGTSVATSNAAKQGIWIREPEYVTTVGGIAFPYGSNKPVMKGGVALTLDFGKTDGESLFMIHVNGGYRKPSEDIFPAIGSVSFAAEVYPASFISMFVEYYWDIQLDEPDGNATAFFGPAGSLDMKQLAGGLVFHTPPGLDIHMGFSYYLGGDQHLFNVITPTASLPMTRVNPEYTIYGGIAWGGFLTAKDSDGDGVPDKEDSCPDEAGEKTNDGCPYDNPDSDGDGFCDPWVNQEGLLHLFKKQCSGIDRCPHESGEGEDGCPLADPDSDGDGVCEVWVAERNMQKKYRGVCEGIDDCPDRKGPLSNNGCPFKKPDPDSDGLCSPWVTDNGLIGKFAKRCTGYDRCPGEAGPKGNYGCPWIDPDMDNDGLCDEWVVQKNVGYYFEKAAEDSALAKEWQITKSCKGLDKCPSVAGPANNEGCPLENPDVDQDGICDAWVAEKQMFDIFEGICSGIDKCPEEPGEDFNQGCPLENSDVDGDSLCADWVKEKNMEQYFESVCHGVDKCPVEAGPEWNMGCPTENPDADGDSLCAPWVSKQKLLDKFADVCHGLDRCEDEAGPEWNKGCPIDDDPDSDHDGVCSQWVADKKLLQYFTEVCTGIDRCPDVAGDDGHGCPRKAPEKVDGLTFTKGKSSLNSNARTLIKSLAKKLNEPEYMDLELMIQGHSDNVESKDGKLSVKRAEEVAKTLAKYGVKKNRIKTVGLGAECPIDDNGSESGRERNRRIEIHFISSDNDGTKCEGNF